MLPHKILLVFLLLLARIAPAQLLIQNTNVIDVEKKKILAGYDVLVQNGLIVSVEKTKKGSLPGTTIIDGSGKYLMPGLVDAHVHFFQSGGLYARPDVINLTKFRPYETEIKWVHAHMEDFLRLYTSVGITSVIDVGSTVNFLKQRDSFATKNYAPTVYMTGPLMTTFVPEAFKNLGDDSPFEEMKNEEQTRKAVRDQIKYKPDFIKIWYIVSDSNVERGAKKNLPLVQAVIDEAHKNNLRVAVHASERITAQLAVEAGADFLVHSVDNEIVGNDFIELLKKKNTVLSPTLVVYHNYGKTLLDEFKFTTDELLITHPVEAATIFDYPFPDTVQAKFLKGISSRIKTSVGKRDSMMAINLKKLVDAGVIIATGTDAGNIGTQHASSFFNEIKAMKDAGMNPWQILQSSTINGAKAIGKETQWGSITKGKVANMVLLNQNPVESLDNWRKISMVINKGVALKPDSIVNNTPEMLVQQQVNGYNAHDLEAFLAPYAEDVEVFDLPGNVAMKGKTEMRKNYQFITNTRGLYCRIINRIVDGNLVVDHEELYMEGRKPFYGVAIYLIENGKIRRVYFPQN